MVFYYLIFFGWLVSASALHALSLSGCLSTKGGIVGQLSVVANSRGTYDVTVVAPDGGHLRYLAIDLVCAGEQGMVANCVAAPSSPHAGSKVSITAAGDRQHKMVISSPLVSPEPLLVEECDHQQLPAVPPTKGCLAYFRGAYYSPALGGCVAEQASGCRNPYQYLDVDECRVAMHLPPKR